MTKTSNPNTTCTLQLCKKTQKPNENKFNTAITEAIDETFSSLNLDKQAIYNHLENTFKIKKEAIPNQIEEFTDAIEQTFSFGAKLIEIRIVEVLHKKIQNFVFIPKKGALCFKEYAVSLRAFLLRTS